MSDHTYDIVLSFAGEDRAIAEKIAEELKEKGVNVFYDKYEEAELWGKDLYEHLSEVYSEQGRYCIMLISKHYAQKAWTNHERKSAQERAFKENEEYILPVRLDDTRIPGIRETVGYLDYRTKSVDSIVEAALKKLGKKQRNDDKSGGFESGNPGPKMPNIKREYTDKDREDFLNEAFAYVREYVRNGLKQLESQHSDIETSFRDITSVKFTGNLYKSGNKVQAFKIWIGGLGSYSSNDAICLSLSSFSIDRDNSMNEMISVKENNGELMLNITMGNWDMGDRRRLSSMDDTAEYLWDRIIKPLEY